MAVSIATDGAFAAGVPAPLFNTHLSLSTSPSQYAPSADGRKFLVLTQDVAHSPLTVVLNWNAGLQRR